MLKGSRLVLAVVVVLGIALSISVFFNIASPYSVNTIVGMVDHRSDYENTDLAGEQAIQYFIGIRPISDNVIVGTTSGQVEDYLVSKEDYDALNANDIVVLEVSWSGQAEVTKILPQEQWIRQECVGENPNYVDGAAEVYCPKG